MHLQNLQAVILLEHPKTNSGCILQLENFNYNVYFHMFVLLELKKITKIPKLCSCMSGYVKAFLFNATNHDMYSAESI